MSGAMQSLAGMMNHKADCPRSIHGLFVYNPCYCMEYLTLQVSVHMCTGSGHKHMKCLYIRVFLFYLEMGSVFATTQPFL